MIVNEKFKVHWDHLVETKPRLNKKGNIILTRKGNQKTEILATTQCNILNITLNSTASFSIFVHPMNRYDRKKGIRESFKLAVSKCPSEDLRKAFWEEFFAVRHPTVSITGETADLLACATYLHSKVTELIIKDDAFGYNEGWRAFSRPEIIKRLSNRLSMYRDKSDYSLLTIIKLCIIGFTNYKRLKDANNTTSKGIS